MSAYVDLYAALWTAAYGPDRYAKRKDSPGQMSLFGHEHDVKDEPRDDHGRWTDGGNSPKDSPAPDDPTPKEATVETEAGSELALGNPKGKEPAEMENSRHSEQIQSIIESGDDSIASLDAVTDGMTDEQAVGVAESVGLVGVTSVWGLRNEVLKRAIATQERMQSGQAGLRGQPKRRVAAATLPRANPLEIKFRIGYVKQRGGIREPAENEAVAIVQRPQSSGTFVQYRPGDVIERNGLKYVVQAAKDGYMRSGEGWKRWEQELVLRLADEADIKAVSAQKAEKDAESKRVMDGMMYS